ncbi:MAG: CoA ester lyase, partial [Roseovarius sp.]|nr:CoA ester lyase [Roseovarius sp.]
MDSSMHPYRSVLYIPGSKERGLEKARDLPTDAIIFDLEDAVAPDAKASARATLVEALRQGGYGYRYKIVRINALTTEWGLEDARALRDAGADAILLPKVNTPSDIDNLSDVIGTDLPVWTMMETPISVFNAREIAAHRQVTGLVAGTNDLIKDLGCRVRADRMPLWASLQMIVMAARAARIVAVDGVYNRFRDGDGLKFECEQGRDLGFDGKTLIHPAQLEIANTA